MGKSDEDEDIVQVSGKNKHDLKTLIQTIPKGFNYYVNIDNEISSPQNYRDVFHLLKTSTVEDTIYFKLNTAGGYINTFVEMYNGIKRCKSKTVAHVFDATSAGAMIMLACDDIIVEDFSTVMIHNISTTISGKAGEIEANTLFNSKWMNNIFDKLYLGFLTKQEVEEIKKGKDVWFHKPEIERRWKNLKKFLAGKK